MEHYIRINDSGIYYNDKEVERIVEMDKKQYTRDHGKISYTVEAPCKEVWVYADTQQKLSKDKQEIMDYAYNDATGPFFNWSK